MEPIIFKYPKNIIKLFRRWSEKKSEKLYGDDKPNTEIHYIKYTDWQKVNGLLLPKKLQWYDSENNLPVTSSNVADFENISVSEKMIDASKFVKPVDGLIGEK